MKIAVTILAAGGSTRMGEFNKLLLLIDDKPMIYYPLSTLMLAGITEILIITNKKDKPNFEFKPGFHASLQGFPRVLGPRVGVA